MSNDASQLLRALSSGVSGARVQPTAGAQSALTTRDIEGGNFQSLLEKARGGTISTGLPVSVARGADVQLSDDQLKRLAVAADVAQASGASRALVTMDGIALRLDVGTRSITGCADLSSGKPITGIDALIQVPGAGQGAVQNTTLTSPSTGTAGLNASLLKALAKRPPA